MDNILNTTTKRLIRYFEVLGYTHEESIIEATKMLKGDYVNKQSVIEVQKVLDSITYSNTINKQNGIVKTRNIERFKLGEISDQ